MNSVLFTLNVSTHLFNYQINWQNKSRFSLWPWTKWHGIVMMFRITRKTVICNWLNFTHSHHRKKTKTFVQWSCHSHRIQWWILVFFSFFIFGGLTFVTETNTNDWFYFSFLKDNRIEENTATAAAREEICACWIKLILSHVCTFVWPMISLCVVCVYHAKGITDSLYVVRIGF